MRLRGPRLFLLFLCFAIAQAQPPAFAQSLSNAELEAMNSRVIELYRAGKYGEAIPLAERYVAATAARYGESAPEYAAALNNLAMLLQATNQLSKAETFMRRALSIDVKSFGPGHPEVATNLNNLAQLLVETNRLAEAEPLMRRALAIDEKSFGPDHPNVATALNNLAELLRVTNRHSEAERLLSRSLAISEKNLGRDHPDVALRLGNLGLVLQATNRLSEAEPLMRRALAIDMKSFGPDHPNVARDLNNLAQLLQARNRVSDAEPLMRRALAIDEKNYGPDHPNVAIDLNNLAGLLKETNHLSQAEGFFRRALAIDEKSFGPRHPDVARDLNNLASLLHDTNRFSEAEPLMRRALAIYEKSFGPDHTKVALLLNNLGLLLKATNSLAEAEPLLRRALAINEKSFGSDHPEVATVLNNLATLLQDTDRLAEAEPLLRRAMAIDEKSFGPDHPEVARDLNNLAQLLKATNRFYEAEPLLRRAGTIAEKSFGPGHPNVATALSNLAGLFEGQGRWQEAAAFRRKAMPIMTGAYIGGEPERGGLGKAVLAQNTGGLRAYARALYHADASDTANRAEGFKAAQWALQNNAADALSEMAARVAKGEEALGKLVLEQHDLFSAREAAYRSLDRAAGKANAKAAEAARAAITQFEARLAEKQNALRQAFPDYAELVNPKPLALVDAQALLGEEDALVLFLPLIQDGLVPEETIVFALTRTEARWTSISLGFRALLERGEALRCGLDSSHWQVGNKGREFCKALLGTEARKEQLPPFDAALAHALYRDLFGGIEGLVQNKRLLIVPSGALTQLPFEVLVTAKPDEALPRFEAYKKAAWLGQRQAITILPSVGSLKALRTAKASAAPEAFIGFGNPLLTGEDGKDRSAWAKQECGGLAPPKQSRIASLAVSIASLFRGGAVNVEKLRQNPPLPETADELCSVGRALGVPESGLSKAIYLGERATVSQVKALSKSGELAKARVVHFATHGLLAGETAMFAKNKAEPALLLTPPARQARRITVFLPPPRLRSSTSTPIGWSCRPATRPPDRPKGRRRYRGWPARSFTPARARCSSRIGTWTPRPPPPSPPARSTR